MECIVQWSCAACWLEGQLRSLMWLAKCRFKPSLASRHVRQVISSAEFCICIHRRHSSFHHSFFLVSSHCITFSLRDHEVAINHQLQTHDILATMGWLWGSSDDASSKAAKDGAYVAPDRTKRVMCWDSRDEYFQCLNRNNILDALKEHEAAEKACGKETKNFEQNCASSWVSCVFPDITVPSPAACDVASFAHSGRRAVNA